MASGEGLFQAAFPFNNSELQLPVKDVDEAAEWYAKSFGLVEVARPEGATAVVVLERDGVRLGFAVNGGDPSQEGAAILVNDIHRAKEELEANGVQTTGWRVDERDGQMLRVFFVVAPDGLCYYFHQPIDRVEGH